MDLSDVNNVTYWKFQFNDLTNANSNPKQRNGWNHITCYLLKTQRGVRQELYNNIPLILGNFLSNQYQTWLQIFYLIKIFVFPWDWEKCLHQRRFGTRCLKPWNKNGVLRRHCGNRNEIIRKVWVLPECESSYLTFRTRDLRQREKKWRKALAWNIR